MAKYAVCLNIAHIPELSERLGVMQVTTIDLHSRLIRVSSPRGRAGMWGGALSAPATEVLARGWRLEMQGEATEAMGLAPAWFFSGARRKSGFAQAACGGCGYG